MTTLNLPRLLLVEWPLSTLSMAVPRGLVPDTAYWPRRVGPGNLSLMCNVLLTAKRGPHNDLTL